MNDLNWAIIYGDLRVFSSADGSWAKAPVWNVMAVAEENQEIGLEIYAKSDVYLMLDGRIIRLSELGFADYMVNVVGFAAYLGPGLPARFVLSKSGQIVDLVSLQWEAAEAGLIKVGRMLSTGQWRPLYDKVMGITGLPVKGCWLPEEKERLTNGCC
jgi:hypothetical protein